MWLAGNAGVVRQNLQRIIIMIIFPSLSHMGEIHTVAPREVPLSWL
jgi:hypothetical protein